jgi:hypothetical protein
MLPSKVMPYLLRLAAPLTDSLIVQMTTYLGKVLVNWLQGSGQAFFGSRVTFRMASNSQGNGSFLVKMFLQFKFSTGNAKIACINVTFCARVGVAAVLGQLLHPQVCPRLQH